MQLCFKRVLSPICGCCVVQLPKLDLTVQVVFNHPLARKSLLLHDLICEAVAAHQESHDLDPDSQVSLSYPLLLPSCMSSLCSSLSNRVMYIMQHHTLPPSWACTAVSRHTSFGSCFSSLFAILSVLGSLALSFIFTTPFLRPFTSRYRPDIRADKTFYGVQLQVQLQQAPVMIEAKRHVHGIDHALAGATQRFQRRRPSACQELMFMFDGDDNGVCHRAATDYGKQAWVNPVLSGTLKVSCDTMTSLPVLFSQDIKFCGASQETMQWPQKVR